jgi:uncharacterized membrane protein
MRPSVMLIGFALGSAAAISFSLGGVAIVFAVLRSDYPQFDTELPALLGGLAIFTGLTLAAGLAFYGQLREAAWRHVAVGLLLVGLAVATWFYWPT